MPERDRGLIEACILRHDGAWERFVETYRSTIRASACCAGVKLGVVGADADELESYVYEKLLENDCHRLRAWRLQSRFSTYLVVVTRNLVRDYCTSARARSLRCEELSLADRDHVPYRNPVEEREWDALREQTVLSALSAVSDKQATIVRLRLGGKTLKEIAELTNRPMGTVSVENSRALDRMRKFVALQLVAPVETVQ
ncbi:MAG: sigma-70 family RNA polymerase sigma factor [Candidatus Hydrogenedentes bacterium]|nr:sigma-70 family RNA polymerase sigma factor [Candidatus Hydrogenedentota bacterium]